MNINFTISANNSAIKMMGLNDRIIFSYVYDAINDALDTLEIPMDLDFNVSDLDYVS